MNPVEDFRVLKVARRNFSINKVNLVGIGDMVDIVKNMDMVYNVNIVDSIDMMNMQKAFGYF